MANKNQEQAPQITVEQFKLRLSIWREAITMYKGGTRLLSHFIQQCDRFVQMLYTADPLVNESLYVLIKSKLRGEALDVVVNNSESWTECKRILINRYSDANSEELLFNKLSVCYQKANQSFKNYADEIKLRLNRLKEHIQLNNENRQIVNMKISFYENVAKNTFINEIQEPYHSFLTQFELNDIEDWLNKCRRHDNHEQQANFLSYMR